MRLKLLAAIVSDGLARKENQDYGFWAGLIFREANLLGAGS